MSHSFRSHFKRRPFPHIKMSPLPGFLILISNISLSIGVLLTNCSLSLMSVSFSLLYLHHLFLSLVEKSKGEKITREPWFSFDPMTPHVLLSHHPPFRAHHPVFFRCFLHFIQFPTPSSSLSLLLLSIFPFKHFCFVFC